MWSCSAWASTMRFRMYCALSGTSRPSAFSTERTDAMACTVVQTPQMRWVKIQASRGSRPCRMVSMPRHMVPLDHAFLTLPPSTSRSMRRCPSMRVTGSMVTRWLMEAPLPAGSCAAGTDAGVGVEMGLTVGVLDDHDGEQPRHQDEDGHADGRHARRDGDLAQRGHVLPPVPGVVRGEVGVDAPEGAGGDGQQRGAEEPASVLLDARREEQDRGGDEERHLEQEE